MSQFDFLDDNFADIRAFANDAADVALTDPRRSSFNARQAIEQSLAWMFTYDRELRQPYEPTLSARLNAPSFRDAAGETVYEFARQVVRLGDKAIADGPEPSRHDSVTAVSALFQFCYWPRKPTTRDLSRQLG